MFNENTLSKDEGSQSEGKAEITPNSVDKGTDRTDQAKQAPKGSEEAIAVAAIDVLFIGGGGGEDVDNDENELVLFNIG